MPQETDANTNVDGDHDPYVPVTFRRIIKAANTYTCWRFIRLDPIRLVAMGRMEDRWGLSFQADLSFEEFDNRLFLLVKIAEKVRSRGVDVKKLVLAVICSKGSASSVNWNEEFGTICISTRAPCPGRRDDLLEPMKSFCTPVKNLLENTYIRQAVRIGEGRLCGIPIDLFSQKYNEAHTADD